MNDIWYNRGVKNQGIPDVIAWKRGFERLEEFRREEIRESSILKDLELLEGAYQSAIFLASKKMETGLGELGKLLAKMKR